MWTDFFEEGDLASLIWQIHEEQPAYPLRESHIHNILFRLKEHPASETHALDDAVFYWGKDGRESEEIKKAIASMQEKFLVTVTNGRVNFQSPFSQDQYVSLKTVNKSLTNILFDFFSSECDFFNEIFKQAPYPFMHTFRAGFVRGLASYIQSQEPNEPEYLDQCPTGELKPIICKSEIEFPQELNLFELEDIFTQDVNSVAMVLDYSKDISQSDSANYKSLLHEVFNLGYNGVWTSFLTVYRIDSGQTELTRDQLKELSAEYQQQINELGDACQRLESDILKVAVRYMPTELTEKQRETLKSLSQ